ncbi:unnamed protein product, partial [marine sediment metagenome]
WIEAESQFIDIMSITELKNVNTQLEQSSKLFVNNIIQRVIAQLLGATDKGFVTLEATKTGYLKVLPMGTGHTVISAAIDESTAATHEIIAAVVGKKIRIVNLMLTVAGETNITLQSDANVLSGPLDFGGTDEPRGMVHHFGDAPLDTVEGEAFKITSSGAVQLSGYVTYFTE